mgnify:CR=1 FL=1
MRDTQLSLVTPERFESSRVLCAIAKNFLSMKAQIWFPHQGTTHIQSKNDDGSTYDASHHNVRYTCANNQIIWHVVVYRTFRDGSSIRPG